MLMAVMADKADKAVLEVMALMGGIILTQTVVKEEMAL